VELPDAEPVGLAEEAERRKGGGRVSTLSRRDWWRRLRLSRTDQLSHLKILTSILKAMKQRFDYGEKDKEGPKPGLQVSPLIYFLLLSSSDPIQCLMLRAMHIKPKKPPENEETCNFL